MNTVHLRLIVSVLLVLRLQTKKYLDTSSLIPSTSLEYSTNTPYVCTA